MSTTHISFSLISRDTWMSTWTELVNWTVYLLEWSNFIGRRWVLSLGKSFSVFFPWQRHSRMCQIPERAGQYWAKRVSGCRTAGTDLGQIGDCSLTSLSSVFFSSNRWPICRLSHILIGTEPKERNVILFFIGRIHGAFHFPLPAAGTCRISFSTKFSSINAIKWKINWNVMKLCNLITFYNN